MASINSMASFCVDVATGPSDVGAGVKAARALKGKHQAAIKKTNCLNLIVFRLKIILQI
jgi:hypothetical protein